MPPHTQVYYSSVLLVATSPWLAFLGCLGTSLSLAVAQASPGLQGPQHGSALKGSAREPWDLCFSLITALSCDLGQIVCLAIV